MVFSNKMAIRFYFIFIYLGFTAQVLKVCRTPGPTAPTALLKMLYFEKGEKIHDMA